MKTIVAGTRTFFDTNLIHSVLDNPPWPISGLISGCCSGPDCIATEWAHKNLTRDKIFLFPVFKKEWRTLGKAAGPMRNQKMVEVADALIVFWDGESRGTKDVITRALKNNLHIYIYNFAPKTKSKEILNENSVSQNMLRLLFDQTEK